MLARRVQDGAEASKKRKDKGQDKVVQVLKTLVGKKKHNDSSSSGGDSEEEDEIFSGSCKESDLLSRQRKLRKLSAEKPGAFLQNSWVRCSVTTWAQVPVSRLCSREQ